MVLEKLSRSFKASQTGVQQHEQRPERRKCAACCGNSLPSGTVLSLGWPVLRGGESWLVEAQRWADVLPPLSRSWPSSAHWRRWRGAWRNAASHWVAGAAAWWSSCTADMVSGRLAGQGVPGVEAWRLARPTETLSAHPGVRKTHNLSFQDCESLQAVFDPALCSNVLRAPAR